MRYEYDPAEAKRHLAEFAGFTRKQQRQGELKVQRDVEPDGGLKKGHEAIDRAERHHQGREQRAVLDGEEGHGHPKSERKEQPQFLAVEFHGDQLCPRQAPAMRSPARVRLARETSVRQASSSPSA